MNSTDITSTPGSRNSRYSAVEPAIAPPNMYVNISRNRTGVIVTSISCSGTCLIFSIPRQPNVSALANALGRAGRSLDAIAALTATSSRGSGSVRVAGVALMPPPPRSPAPRPGGR